MKTKIILLVEDNPDDETLTIRALAKNKIHNQVVVVRDGAEALDYLFGRNAHAGRDTNVLPQIVLLDLKLPKVDGLEVLRQIKSDAALRMIPVVMMTSSRQEQDVVASYELGVNAYVVKPMKFQDFVEAVKQVDGFWAGINEVPEGLRASETAASPRAPAAGDAPA